MINLLVVPTIEYPIMYRAYYDSELDETLRIKNLTEGQPTNALVQVYREYYNLNLDLLTLSTVNYTYDLTPYTIVFIVVYLENGLQKYIWEYLPIWAKIKQLNDINKIV